MNKHIARYQSYQEGGDFDALVPLVPLTPVCSPSMALAIHSPENAYDILCREISSRDHANDLDAIKTSISEGCGIARDWLRNREHGEKNLDVEQTTYLRNADWFSSGSHVRTKLSVRIW